MLSGAALRVTVEQRSEIRFCVAYRIAELEQRAKVDAKLKHGSVSIGGHGRDAEELALLRELLAAIE